MSATTEAQTTPRLLRDQCHLFFDPNEPPKIRVPPGTRLVVETEDAHLGSIRTEQDVYPTLASVFERLGGANPVTGPIYVEGVKPGDCVTVTIEDIVPGAVQGQGYTVLSQGLGGLVSSYTLQDGLEPTTVICPIRDGKVHFPAGDRTIEIPISPFLGTIGVAPAVERRYSFVQGADFLGNTDLPLNGIGATIVMRRSEEHTSELQSLTKLVCRLLLEKKKTEQMSTNECRTIVEGTQIAERKPSGESWLEICARGAKIRRVVERGDTERTDTRQECTDA